ncbi:hypothetical protein MTP99_002404 [Tenebrio molitor]|jgi:hypothetical protein|nr:hypothetical protein MTP99_002404 [Tenebrio molitor]
MQSVNLRFSLLITARSLTFGDLVRGQPGQEVIIIIKWTLRALGAVKECFISLPPEQTYAFQLLPLPPFPSLGQTRRSDNCTLKNRRPAAPQGPLRAPKVIMDVMNSRSFLTLIQLNPRFLFC